MTKNKNQAKKTVCLQSLPMIHPNAAGIDVGAKEHVVAVPADRDPEPVRSFKAFTPDLYELADWLKGCAVETVALESTGIYWITLYEILEERGFQVRVVNARHVKNVPGRTKTDVLDCQWIQKLHSFGLLSGSFRPDQQVRTLRSLMRLRDNLVVNSTQSVHHMQKALFEMNVQLSNVISDIVGESGMRILEAILAGERDPEALARPEDPFCDLYAAMVTVPMAGRNLLTDAAWRTLNIRCLYRPAVHGCPASTVERQRRTDLATIDQAASVFWHDFI